MGGPTAPVTASPPAAASGSEDQLIARRRIRNRAIAIGLSTVPFGVSFGAVSVAAGLSVTQTCVLSLVLFSGASQFALVSIVAAGGGLLSAVGTALMLGTRNGLYGTSVAALVRPRGWRRLIAAQMTIDETTAMAVAESPAGHAGAAFWMTAASVYLCWNLATVMGAFAGRGLGSPSAAGLDAAAPAAFLALLGTRLSSREGQAVAALAAGAALATVWCLPAGAPVLVGGAVALLAAMRRRQ